MSLGTIILIILVIALLGGFHAKSAAVLSTAPATTAVAVLVS